MNPRNALIIALLAVVIAVGIVLLSRKYATDPADEDVHHETGEAMVSERADGSMPPAEDKQEMEGLEEIQGRDDQAKLIRAQLTAFWALNATSGFVQTRNDLVTDLGLNAAQSEKIEQVFARREKELTDLLARMTSGEAGAEKIIALLRNKGLREDLEPVLSEEQLKAFDLREENQAWEKVEALAYRDMSEVSAVIRLTDSQKKEVLAALMDHAPVKVEQEADARAFMSLTYGAMAQDMDSLHIRGLSNLMGETSDIDIYSPEYRQQIEQQKTERIENKLSVLRGILDETQLTRYREHLEAESAW